MLTTAAAGLVLVRWTSTPPLVISTALSTADFIVAYVTLVIFAVLYVFWKLWKRTKFVRLDNMDFDTGRRELDSMADKEAARYKKPTTFVGKVWDFLM
ncbi:hypothetical protein JCM3774_004926 [Rhodotorula dairenensis]